MEDGRSTQPPRSEAILKAYGFLAAAYGLEVIRDPAALTLLRHLASGGAQTAGWCRVCLHRRQRRMASTASPSTASASRAASANSAAAATCCACSSSSQPIPEFAGSHSYGSHGLLSGGGATVSSTALAEGVITCPRPLTRRSEAREPVARRRTAHSAGAWRAPDVPGASTRLRSIEEKPRVSRAFLRGERGDSNPRPPGPQPGALPTELRPPRGRQSLATGQS